VVATLAVFSCEQPQPTTAPSDAHGAPRGRGHTQVDAIAVILPPVIDGRLAEGIWQHTPAYSDFVVIGRGAEPALRRTEFRIAYDAANLYIAMTCPTDTSIGPPKVRHWQDDDEAIGEDESCRVLLWPEPNRPNTAIEVTVNPQGVVLDARRHQNYPLTSTVWDGPTQAEATISRGAWHAELRVPLRRLGVPDRPWHVNVIRYDALAKQQSSLAPPPASSAPTSGIGKNPSGFTDRSALDRVPQGRATLRWPAPARPFTTGPLPIRRLRLADMEGTLSAWRTENANVTASDQHVVDGRRSLRVTCHAGGGRIALTPQQETFSGWDTLRLGIFVDGGSAAALAIRLRDILGRSSAGWFFARPGANDVVLPLDLLGAGLRLRHIKAVELLSPADVTLWLDHLRLEEDSLSYHERAHRPVRPSRSNLEVRFDPDIVADSTSTPPIAVDVTVPLFRTQKVRRLERRTTRVAEPMMFGRHAFAGHDARDPVRITAFLKKGEQGVFAFREQRLTATSQVVTFGAKDFPSPPAGPIFETGARR
jgi:hypothetical protein